MRNPIRKYNEWRKSLNDKEISERVNGKVYVANDPNDPENGIYVFVANIPVMKVTYGNNDRGNTLPIDKVGEFVGNVKRMYRNAINNKPINDDIQREEGNNVVS